ncbi:hypothetical protein ACFL1H_08095 [Nanoarchaeota archaeon]
MEDKTLLKTALLLTITGIIVLFIMSDNINLQNMEISDFDNKEFSKSLLDKEIKVTGKLIKVQQNNNSAILEIEQHVPKRLTIFLFKDEELNLEKDTYITVSGEFKEYEDKFELIANKIEINS